MDGFEPAVCPQCGGADARVVIESRDLLHGLPGTFVVTECRACQQWFQNPRPTVDALPGLYPEDYGPHAEAEPDHGVAWPPTLLTYLRDHLGYTHLSVQASGGLRGSWLWRPVHRWHCGIDLIPRFVPGGTVLELGCGAGARLATLRDLGWQHIRGVELSGPAVARARARGFDVAQGPIEDFLDTVAEGSCDVIVSSMVLEHLRDPFGIVRRIATKLKPGGQFLFSTVCREGLDARLYGKYWGSLDLPRHLAYFRRVDLDRLLDGWFTQQAYFHQVAPVDFVRAAGWRLASGRGGWRDRVVVARGHSPAARLLITGLAWLGRTSRISCAAVRTSTAVGREAAT